MTANSVLLALTLALLAACRQSGDERQQHADTSSAMTVPAPQPDPAPEWVQDHADLFTSEEEELLARQSIDAHKWMGVQVVVVTIESLEGRAIEEVALERAREMKIGQAGVNNGGLILIAPHDRKARIEIGYGLEWEIPDSMAKRFIDSMVARFRVEKYYEGTRLALDSIIARATAVRWEVRFVGRRKSDHDSLREGSVVAFTGTIDSLEPRRLCVSGFGDRRRWILLPPYMDPTKLELAVGTPVEVHARIGAGDTLRTLGVEKVTTRH